MSLVLLDLDNTLIDRELLFAGWAAAFVTAHGGDAADVAAIVRADADGYAPREAVAAVVRERLGLAEDDAHLVATQRAGLIERVAPDPSVLRTLRRLRASGRTVGVVTNGGLRPQSAKLERSGIAALVDGRVISEEAGVAKPDPRIFRLAAERLGRALAAGDWMIGDSPSADVAGGRAAGLRTVWIRRGRTWPGDAPPPTAVADSVAEAVEIVLARPD